MKRGATLVATILFASACGTEPATQTVVCSDFRVGADLTQASFGVEGPLALSFNAFAQAAGDVATVAATMLRDVGASCEAIALDLGGRADDDRVAGKDDADRVSGFCAIAAERVSALAPRLRAAHFRLATTAAICIVDVDYQTTCEATCRTDASCKESAIADRCAPADRVGSCAGACTGTCDVPKRVSGAYRQAFATCDGRCLGGCSVALASPACAALLAPPRCAGDEDCQASCRASAMARATCSGGDVEVRLDPAALADPELAAASSTLARNVRPVLAAASGRAKDLHDHASSLIDAAGHVLARGEKLGSQAAACGVLIGQTGDTASKNLAAALGGANAVSGAVGGP